MAEVAFLKNSREAPRNVRSHMDTMLLSLKDVDNWRVPPFQRPVRLTAKVKALAEELKADGYSISGVLTLGKIGDDDTTWIVDGQHRLEGFKISGLDEVLADVRICKFDTMADMADEFVRLNSALVRMRPDDVLRGFESSSPQLQKVRRVCPFVGYVGGRRRSPSSTGPYVGMSSVLRCWFGADGDKPSPPHVTAAQFASVLDDKTSDDMIGFLIIADQAWGGDYEYARLWAGLNLTMSMWIYRQSVLRVERADVGRKKATMNRGEFKQAMMALSARGNYLDWLVNRHMSDRDRGPCYRRMKGAIVARFNDTYPGRKVWFPQPSWAAGAGAM